MSAAATPREAELLVELGARDGQLEELSRENALLRQKVNALVRRLFGAKSERLDSGQLLLLFAGETSTAVVAATVAAAPTGRRQVRPARTGPGLPEHLPVVEEVLDPARSRRGAGWARRSANSSTTNRGASSAAGWCALNTCRAVVGSTRWAALLDRAPARGTPGARAGGPGPARPRAGR